MKTLLLAPELFTTNGGIPRMLRLYLKALCELTPSAPQNHVGFVALNDDTADSADLRRYSTPALRHWETCHRRKLQFIRATLRHSRPGQHVVCGHIAQLPVAWAAQRCRRGLRYDLVAHGIEVWRDFTLAERLALRAARRILCVSAYTRDEMRRHCGLPESRFVVLPNALDPFFPIAGQPPSPAAEPVVLTVSRLVRSDAYKGIDHLIQAMPRIRQRVPGARLQVVGQGDDLPRLTALARSAGVAQCVEFLGYIGDQPLQARLRECALFALPSQREGFGLVFLEAMAQGRPCLAAQAGGVPEVLTPESGSLVPFGNVEALANAAAEALQRTWDGAAILARAKSFAYPQFRERLKTLLAA